MCVAQKPHSVVHRCAPLCHHLCMLLQVLMPRKYAIRMPRPEGDSKEGLCNDAYAAPLWEKGGVRNYDLVLFLTANATKDCKAGALAYTLPCLTDMVTGRPTAAGMNICPLSLKSPPSRLLNTLVHELVHALVSTVRCAPSALLPPPSSSSTAWHFSPFQ